MKILVDSNNIVIDARNSIEIVPEGFMVDNTVYGLQLGLSLIEIADQEVVAQRDKIVAGVVALNPDYIEPVVFVEPEPTPVEPPVEPAP